MAGVRVSRTQLLSCQTCLRQSNSTSSSRHIRHYNVSKLSPIQPPSPKSPSSPLFVPRKLGHSTRLQTYYDTLVAPNLLLMSYDPTAKPKKQLPPLRWDGTSPYHKNRPQPRERPLLKLKQPLTARNIPRIESITIHSFMKTSIQKRSDLLNAALAVQSITGERPVFCASYNSVAVFKLRPRIPVAVKATLRGPKMWNFLSVLTEVVLPRVKDFEGIHYVQSEGNGSINFGFGPATMSLFPQIEANFDSFAKIPGFDVAIATTATTTADARLLLSAYGVPFKKGPRHIPKKAVGGISALKKYKARNS